MALPAANPHDIDNLLAGYRAARAQQALFDPRGGVVAGYDEFVDAAGNVRPSWLELADCVGERGRDGLDHLRSVVRSLVDNDGITYVQVDTNGEAVTNGDGSAVPGAWHLDALPLLLSATDWDTLESGLVQRSRLLDAVLADLYGPRRSVTGGVLPPQLLFAHPGYIRAARGIEVPGRHQLFMHACDVSRAADGAFRVNADWTQAPSGAGYALADRRVVAHAIPDLYERIGPRPASPWAQALRLALIDAAPESAEEPVVVVLSPGIHSETAFDQAYLASVLGFPLVESADLVVRDGKLWMRSLGTLKRVDVVLRRVDAEYADPLDLRADSRLGVVGLVEVLRRGAVTVVNTLGSGILESPGLLRFLPELAESAARRDAAAGDRAGVLGRHQRRAVAPVEQAGFVVDQTGERRRHDRRPRADGQAAQGTGCPHRGHAVAVGRPGAAAVLVGANGLPPGRVVVGQRRHAAVHGGPARWLRADDRRPRLPAGAGQRRLRDENRCRQGYLGSYPDPCHGRADSDVAAGRTARDDAEPDAGHQLAACAVRPVLDGALRRARGEHGQAADRHPRALPRIPLPAGHGGQRVRAGAAGRARADHRNRHRRERRLPRDDRHRPDDAVVADRRPAPRRCAGAIRRAARAGGARGPRPDVQRHLDGVGSGRTRGAASRSARCPNPKPRARLTWCRRTAKRLPGCWRCPGWPPSRWCRTSAGR